MVFPSFATLCCIRIAHIMYSWAKFPLLRRAVVRCRYRLNYCYQFLPLPKPCSCSIWFMWDAVCTGRCGTLFHSCSPARRASFPATSCRHTRTHQYTNNPTLSIKNTRSREPTLWSHLKVDHTSIKSKYHKLMLCKDTLTDLQKT